MHHVRLLATTLGTAVLLLVAGLFLDSSAVASSTTPDGTARLVGYSVVTSNPVTVGPRQFAIGYAGCPESTVVVGGGASLTASSPKTSLSTSEPSFEDGWNVAVSNPSGSRATFRAYAVCAPRPARYRIVKNSLVTQADTQTEVVATCPRRTVPLGGGGSGTTTEVTQALSSSYPAGKSWHVTVNTTTDDAAASASVVCAKRPSNYTVVPAQGGTVSVPKRSEGGSSTVCPIGTRPVGGGIEVRSTSTLVALRGTYPIATSRTGWSAFLSNRTSSSVDALGYAVCAS